MTRTVNEPLKTSGASPSLFSFLLMFYLNKMGIEQRFVVYTAEVELRIHALCAFLKIALNGSV